MRVLGTIILAVALMEWVASAAAGEALPESGAAKLAAYQICRPLAVVDMGPSGSQSATECNGIVKNMDGAKMPDNLAIRCLEDTSARPGAYKYSGTCVQSDADGDKLFMTYDGLKTGQIKWIGGTGKYKDVLGTGTVGVVVAPGGHGQSVRLHPQLRCDMDQQAEIAATPTTGGAGFPSPLTSPPRRRPSAPPR